jgi:F-box and WD-40 domain protein 1/11
MRLVNNWAAGRFSNFQLPQPEHANEGHTQYIYAVQMYGQHLVSGSLDRTIRIWNLDSNRLVGQPLAGHHDGVHCLQFDPRTGHDIIISGSLGGELILWTFSSGKMLERVAYAHHDAIVCLKFDEKLLITSSADETIKVWDRQSLRHTEPVKTLNGHEGSVNAIDFAADTLVSASAKDGLAWHIRDFGYIHVLYKGSDLYTVLCSVVQCTLPGHVAAIGR